MHASSSAQLRTTKYEASRLKATELMEVLESARSSGEASLGPGRQHPVAHESGTVEAAIERSL